MSNAYTLRGYNIDSVIPETRDITVSNHRNAGLLQLPPDVRLCIYDALVERFSTRHNSKTIKSQPLKVLASTCRSLYVETRPYTLRRTIVDVKVPMRQLDHSIRAARTVTRTISRLKALPGGEDVHADITHLTVRLIHEKNVPGAINRAFGELCACPNREIGEPCYKPVESVAAVLVLALVTLLPRLRQLIVMIPAKLGDTVDGLCAYNHHRVVDRFAERIEYALGPTVDGGRNVRVHVTYPVKRPEGKFPLHMFTESVWVGNSERNARDVLTITVMTNSRYNVGPYHCHRLIDLP
ncbi:hypothetical protein BT63DRAFT_460415 [Microthyrium microscopicum]|uniref:Uncharacterized protein n=1 Tax=Microthyrium microscopicum TaxID=703497 RepID=A0A6A6TWC1_9PEZI|nr:hypothetical protein BT63DRAFT_460415 [Microthyrium microscopicum]